MSGAAEVVVDAGHSRVKWGRCRHGELVNSSLGACALDDPGPLLATLKRESIDQLIWSPQSHVAALGRLRNQFRALGVSCRTVTTGALDLPVAPAYPNLGVDRWLALQWPWLQTRNAFCVVDCGTAVTVDAVDADGRHLGGWIMAGLRTMMKGFDLTLPGLPAPEPAPETSMKLDPARDSASAIGRGIGLQLIGGVDQALGRLEATLGGQFACWLTGGDAPLLVDALDRPVRQEPHLVLRGLALAGTAP